MIRSVNQMKLLKYKGQGIQTIPRFLVKLKLLIRGILSMKPWNEHMHFQLKINRLIKVIYKTGHITRFVRKKTWKLMQQIVLFSSSPTFLDCYRQIKTRLLTLHCKKSLKIIPRTGNLKVITN